ncbi:hypothetical protein RclHR1_06240005 [Rhizophagus clarus]|uniref:Uncharacterized protein n=1 Tax=Rhizophagus clarus TaxID=94130 RepID=A0A2Z6SIA5_9GLOM|nr:hypothetical protein RclHR1_06240005 [Rhizophagus clarus]
MMRSVRRQRSNLRNIYIVCESDIMIQWKSLKGIVNTGLIVLRSRSNLVCSDQIPTYTMKILFASLG